MKTIVRETGYEVMAELVPVSDDEPTSEQMIRATAIQSAVLHEMKLECAVHQDPDSGHFAVVIPLGDVDDATFDTVSGRLVEMTR